MLSKTQSTYMNNLKKIARVRAEIIEAKVNNNSIYIYHSLIEKKIANVVV